MYTGEKVRLREYRREDIRTRLNYINDPDLQKFIVSDIPYPISICEEEKWFESISCLNDRYKFAIETIEESVFIGGCSINDVDWKNSVATIGIFIGNKDYWGRGYGTDATKTLVGFIFNQINMNKIRLTCYSFNTRAIESYKKCGFVIEGVLRQEIFKDGKYHDKIAMGLLRNDFISRNN